MDIHAILIRLRVIFRSRWLAPWRLLLGVLIAASLWGWFDVRLRGYAKPGELWSHKSDLTVYTEAGAAFFDGRPPYEVQNPRGWTYVYPPILAMALAPLHAMAPQDQVMVWFFICLAMCWGTYRECARIVAALRRSESSRTSVKWWFPWLGILAAAAATLPTLNCLQRGQVSIVILYFLVLGLRLILTGRSNLSRIAGGIMLALPIAIKIVPILPVAFLLFIQLVCFLRQGWRKESTALATGRQLAGSMLGVGLGLALFFFLIPAALIGWNTNLHHLDTWAQQVLYNVGSSTATPGFEQDTHSVRNQCLGNALYRLGNFGDYVLAGGTGRSLCR